IIHPIPLQYKLDDKPILGSTPIGLRGNKLECRMLFITCLEHHLHTLIEAVEEAGVEVIDVMAAPMAASLVTLTKSQKIAGCALANIGAETLTLAVFDENKPQSVAVFPVGSSNITNDLALGFKIALDEAEHLKVGGITTFSIPRKKLDDIIDARLEDMFDLMGAHLKKVGLSGLLPAGIIITGGGASINGIEENAKSSLLLPAKVASLHAGDPTKSPFKNSSWSVAYGLCFWGLSTDDGGSVKLGNFAKRAKSKALAFIKQFLP
ncbi:MAG TPA: cell division FtsA domain-containing protein, partial [Candidatus Nanoarchaeia archaeon]|nr:cell division FtsA domain-containing protein [Candidatus Nanoarchaeia archaeon]